MIKAQNIRSAVRNDVPVLKRLMQTFYAEADLAADARRLTDMFAEFVSDNRLGMVWLLMVDGKEVGYVAMTFTYSLEYGGPTAFVEDLFVERPYRRHGLGQLALNKVEEEARRRGVRALHLEVGGDNAAARKLYDRSGYVASDRLLLTKQLGPPLHAV